MANPKGRILSLADLGHTSGCPVVALRGDTHELVLTTADGREHRIRPPSGLTAVVEIEAGPEGPQTLVATARHGKWQDAAFGYGDTEPALSPHWEAEVSRGRPGLRYPNGYRGLEPQEIRARALGLGEMHLKPLAEAWETHADPAHVRNPDKWAIFLRGLLPGRIWVGNPQTPEGLRAYGDLITNAQTEGKEYWVTGSPYTTVYLP